VVPQFSVIFVVERTASEKIDPKKTAERPPIQKEKSHIISLILQSVKFDLQGSNLWQTTLFLFLPATLIFQAPDRFCDAR
jgi:hypothetical protein